MDSVSFSVGRLNWSPLVTTKASKKVAVGGSALIGFGSYLILSPKRTVKNHVVTGIVLTGGLVAISEMVSNKLGWIDLKNLENKEVFNLKSDQVDPLFNLNSFSTNLDERLSQVREFLGSKYVDPIAAANVISGGYLGDYLRGFSPFYLANQEDLEDPYNFTNIDRTIALWTNQWVDTLLKVDLIEDGDQVSPDSLHVSELKTLLRLKQPLKEKTSGVEFYYYPQLLMKKIVQSSEIKGRDIRAACDEPCRFTLNHGRLFKQLLLASIQYETGSFDLDHLSSKQLFFLLNFCGTFKTIVDFCHSKRLVLALPNELNMPSQSGISPAFFESLGLEFTSGSSKLEDMDQVYNLVLEKFEEAFPGETSNEPELSPSQVMKQLKKEYHSNPEAFKQRLKKEGMLPKDIKYLLDQLA